MGREEACISFAVVGGYRVGGLDYLLKRSDIDTDATGKTSHLA